MIRDDRQMENLHPATFSGSLVLCTAIGLHIARRQLTMAPRHTSGEETHGRRTGLGARRDKWRQWWILPIPFYYWPFPSVFERFWSILSIFSVFNKVCPFHCATFGTSDEIGQQASKPTEYRHFNLVQMGYGTKEALRIYLKLFSRQNRPWILQFLAAKAAQ